MKLSDFIKEYRSRTNMSLREFSRRCGISHSYISFIEHECDPKTKRPPVPTIQQYKKIASATDISLNDLFEIIDDSPVDISFESVDLTKEEEQLLSLWRGAEADARKYALQILANNQKKDMLSKAK